ncbi:ribosome biogenesis GTPase Der [Bdellovibrionota bacterium FG-1]
MTAPKPVRVVIVGRPNVGKSTLFNRLVGRRRALVHDLPGVTRDRLEVQATWWVRARSMEVLVVDTGGVGGDRFAEEIEKQVKIALSEADCVLMTFDGAAGLTPADEQLVRELIQSGLLTRVPVIGIVNKVDIETHEDRLGEFYETGLDNLITISAEHGRGIEDLRAEVAKAVNYPFLDTPLLSEDGEAEEDENQELSDESDPDAEESELPDLGERRVPRVAILGRPNVGKSTLVNSLLGKERMITSPIAGTTIDSIDSVVQMNGKPFVVIDTAGIRRKSKTEAGVEVLSVLQSRKALESADIAILVIDGESGMTDQDEKIGGLIEEAGVSVVLAVNKWDTQRQNKDFTRDIAAEAVRKEMGFLQYAPIVFMSAKECWGLDELGNLMDDILHQRRLKILTHDLTEWVRHEATIHNPQNAKFFLAHQSGRHPPTFVVHVNDPELIHFSLKRHLVNSLRARWGFMGSPVRLLFVEGKNRRSMPKPGSPRPIAKSTRPQKGSPRK